MLDDIAIRGVPRIFNFASLHGRKSIHSGVSLFVFVEMCRSVQCFAHAVGRFLLLESAHSDTTDTNASSSAYRMCVMVTNEEAQVRTKKLVA
jgi:hypothetical protein